MEIGLAWKVLGLDPTTGLIDVRRRYRALLFQAHPDHQDETVDYGPDSDRRTRELITSFRVIEAALGSEGPLPSGGLITERTAGSFGANPPGEPNPDVSGQPAESDDQFLSANFETEPLAAVRVLERDTLSMRGPSDQVFAWLLEAGAAIGEITYLDRQNELFESLLKTVDGDAISLVCTLQGRADETTEAFFTMEPLGIARHPLPDLADVVELIAHHLRVNLS